MTVVSFEIIARDLASRTFKEVGNAAEKSNSKIGKFGAVAAKGAGAVALLGIAAGAFVAHAGVPYVASLNKIQALTGANAKQMKAAAEQLESQKNAYAAFGQTTGDAAAGVVELAKSGLSLKDSLNAVYGTMLLAKAGEMSVSDASAVVANSLNTFGLKAKDAAKVANYLANAANISSADVSDLAESLKYVSPVAASAGVGIKQTAALMAELANSGMKGSQAGTSLRTFLLNLQAPAAAGAKALGDLNVKIFDSAGKMRPLRQIIGDLSGSLKGLSGEARTTDLKAIFGKTGIAGATTILKLGTDGLDKYTAGIGRAGAAAKLAEAQTQGLAGTFSKVKAWVDSTAQELYRKWSPAVNDALIASAKYVADLWNNTLSPALSRFGQFLQDKVIPQASKLGDVVAHNLKPILDELVAAFQRNKPELAKFVDAIKQAAPPIMKLVGAAIVAGTYLAGKFGPTIIRIGEFVDRLIADHLINMIKIVGKVADATVKWGQDSRPAIVAIGNMFRSLWNGAIEPVAKFIIGAYAKVLSSFSSMVHAFTSVPGAHYLFPWADGLAKQLDTASGKANHLADSIRKIPTSHTVDINIFTHHMGGLGRSNPDLAGMGSGGASGRPSLLTDPRGFGNHLMDDLTRGIADRNMKLQTAMSKVGDILNRAKSRTSNLEATRSGFLSTFTSDNLFATDVTGGGTEGAPTGIAALLAAAKGSRTQAGQLLRDIRNVTGRGLSKALVNQLRSEGTSGAAALHALATGSTAQIRQFNALNAATSRDLQAAGMAAGNYSRGGSIADDIRRARKQERVLDRLDHSLRDLARTQKENQTIIVEIDSEAIIRSIKRRNKRKGVKSAGV